MNSISVPCCPIINIMIFLFYGNILVMVHLEHLTSKLVHASVLGCGCLWSTHWSFFYIWFCFLLTKPSFFMYFGKLKFVFSLPCFNFTFFLHFCPSCSFCTYILCCVEAHILYFTYMMSVAAAWETQLICTIYSSLYIVFELVLDYR